MKPDQPPEPDLEQPDLPPTDFGEDLLRVAFETLPWQVRRHGFEEVRTKPALFIFLRRAAERLLQHRRAQNQEP
ncbi:MAG TPA: hypothetical protein VN667_09215 [Burkholderiales bacterium]|nr:hypothetical protein [Burkholderiales bacterium]